MNSTEGILVASTNHGRLAIEHPDGPDLTSGRMCAIYLANQWLHGHIEYSHYRGYYFVANDRSICGLCVGMRVQLGG